MCRLGVVTTLLGLVQFALVGAAHAAALPDLPDVLRQHEDIARLLRSGRIQYRLERTGSDSILSDAKVRVARDLRGAIEAMKGSHDFSAESIERTVYGLERQLEEADQRAVLVHLHRYGQFEVRLLFDKAEDSFLAETAITQDAAALAEQYGLNDLGRERLPMTVVRSLVKDKEVKYESGNDAVTFDVAHQYRLLAEEVLRFGLLDRRMLIPEAEWSMRQSPDGMVTLEGVIEDTRVEFLLDPGKGWRWTNYRSYDGDRVVAESVCEYTMWGESLFPSAYVHRMFDKNGEQVVAESYTFTSVELNVPLEPGDFAVQYPDSAAVFDKTTGVTLRQSSGPPPPHVQRRMLLAEAEEMAEEALRGALLEASESFIEAPPDGLTGPMDAATEFSVQDAEAEAPLPPAPAKTRDGAKVIVWATLAGFSVLILLAVCVAYRKRRTAP